MDVNLGSLGCSDAAREPPVIRRVSADEAGLGASGGPQSASLKGFFAEKTGQSCPKAPSR